MFGCAIHRMQMWRTTRSVPGTSRMKARLVRLRCFVLTMLSRKVLLCCRFGPFVLPSLRVFVFLNATATELSLPQQRKFSFFQFLCSPLAGNQRDGGKEFTIADGTVYVQVGRSQKMRERSHLAPGQLSFGLMLSLVSTTGQFNFIRLVIAPQYLFRAIPCEWTQTQITSSFEREIIIREQLFFNLGKTLAMKIVLEHHQTPHKLVIQTIFS